MGAISGTVNQFTGDVALSIPVVALPGRNGLDLSIALNYTSNIHKIINNENKLLQASWVGLGWSLSVNGLALSIKSSHNGTQAVHDDVYYMAEGVKLKFKSHLSQDVDLYCLENNAFVRIERHYDNANDVIDKWIVRATDGTIMEYGGSTNCRDKLAVWGMNWIGVSRENPSGYANVTWYLKRVTNTIGNELIFEYYHEDDNIATTTYCRATYLSKIIDTYGREVDFILANRDANEYEDPFQRTGEPDAYMEQYEKKYLDQILVKNADGTTHSSYDLVYTDAANHFVAYEVSLSLAEKFCKRLLTSAIPYDRLGAVQPGTYFTYLPSAGSGNQGAISEIVYPGGARVKYEYTTINNNATLVTQINNNQPSFGSKTVMIAQNYVLTFTLDDGNLFVYAYYWTGCKWEGGYVDYLTGIHSDTWRHNVLLGDQFFVVNKNANDYDNGALYVYHWNEVERQWIHDPAMDFVTDVTYFRVVSGANYIAAIKKKGGQFYKRIFTGTEWLVYDEEKPWYNHEWYHLSGHRDYFVLIDESPANNDNLVRYWVHNNTFESATLPIGNDYKSVTCGDFFVVSIEDGSEHVYRWYSDGGFGLDTQISGVDDNQTITMTSGSSFYFKDQDAEDLWCYSFDGNLWALGQYNFDHFNHTDMHCNNDHIVFTDYYDASSRWMLHEYDPDIDGWSSNPTHSGVWGDLSRNLAQSPTSFAYTNNQASPHESAVFRRDYQSAAGWTIYNTIATHEDGLTYSADDFYLLQKSAYDGQLPNTVQLLRYDDRKKDYLPPVTLTTLAHGEEALAYFNTAVVYCAECSTPYVKLVRIVDQQYQNNSLLDWPVQYVRVSPDGDTSYESVWQFEYENGRYDQTGRTAQYNKATLILPDNNGQIETYFFNGLNNTEVGATFPSDKSGSNMSTMYTQMTGSPYRTKTYEYADGSYNLIGETIN